MSRMIVTILFALCISQYASAAAVFDSRNDIKTLKGEVDTLVEILKVYTENYIYELAEAQEKAENNFEAELIKNVHAAFDEIKNAAQEKGNSAKINQCVEAAKAKLDSLKVNSPKDATDCVESQEEEEVNNIFGNLIDEISAGKHIQRLIKSLEKDADASNGNDSNVEKKISSVRASLDKLEDTVTDLMEEGGKIVESVENQIKECNNNQLTDVNTSIVELKENAFQCISQA